MPGILCTNLTDEYHWQACYKGIENSKTGVHIETESNCINLILASKSINFKKAQINLYKQINIYKYRQVKSKNKILNLPFKPNTFFVHNSTKINLIATEFQTYK